MLFDVVVACCFGLVVWQCARLFFLHHLIIVCRCSWLVPANAPFVCACYMYPLYTRYTRPLHVPVSSAR
jgi:hypothetical protein